MNPIFEIAKSGLFSARQSSTTVSNNIANANTPGYTRQRSELSAQVMRKNGYILGRGVTVKHIQRLRNALTDQQIIHKDNALGGLNEQNRVYKQLESLLTTDSGNALDTQISNFFDAFSELANNPQDLDQRRVLLTKAQTMVATFHNTANNLENIARQTKKTAQSRVDKVNDLLQNLNHVNADIARSQANGKPDLSGVDQQTEQLKALSKLMNINTAYNDNGTVEVRVGGITVLGGGDASTITAETAPGRHVFRLRLDSGKLIKPSSGALAADQQMIETAIPDLQQHLDNISQTLVSEVNKLHSSGYALNDNTQRNFFNATNISAQSISINKALLEHPDDIAASSVQHRAGNNDIAIEISKLQDKNVLNGETLTDSAVTIMSKPGNRIDELKSQTKSQQTARQLLINQQQSQAGVNIDEELTDLIKYQNAYQASARVLQVGQEMSETLLNIV
jgi:flagellar hook-associated protein 1 FlgK